MNLAGYIDNYLKNTQILQLASSQNNRPWVISVYFVTDAKRNIYWLSFPSRRHSQEIASNTNVAATMMVKPDKPVIGLSVEGAATIVENFEEVKPIIDAYVQKYNAGHTFYENLLSASNQHVMYKLTPSKFVLFDEVHFPSDGRQELIV